jgi:hypothetical protein
MSLALAAALAACMPSVDAKEPAQAGLENWEIEERAVPHSMLQGQWRVVAIGGKLLSDGQGVRVLIVDDGILVYGGGGSPPLRYGIDGLAFRTCKSPDYVPPNGIILIGYPKRFGDVYRILEQAERVETIFGTGLRITGGGKSITLFRE